MEARPPGDGLDTHVDAIIDVFPVGGELNAHVIRIMEENKNIVQARQALCFFDNKEHTQGKTSQQVKGDCVFCQNTRYGIENYE